MPYPITVSLCLVNGKPGYDLTIHDELATVQDYIAAMENAIEILPLFLHRKKANKCAGCAECCKDAILLNWVDVMMIREQLSINQVAKIRIRENDFAIGIILSEEKEMFCSFLDRTNNLCTIYPVRPLVCRVYVCAPSTKTAFDIRNHIIHKGQEDLIRRWVSQVQEWGEFLFEKFDREKGVNVYHGFSKDWPPNAFSGKSNYNEVLLKDLLPAELWEKVYKPLGTNSQGLFCDLRGL